MKHKIEIPLAECDLEDFEKLVCRDNYSTSKIVWNFTADTGEEVEVCFIRDKGVLEDE